MKHAVPAITLVSVLCAGPILAHSGAKYEPGDGRVLHGLGQYVPLFYTDEENWQFVSDYQAAVGSVPIIYAAYRPINPSVVPLDTTNLTDIVRNHTYRYYLNLGIYYFDANRNVDATAILNGDWDAQITAIATEVKSLPVPCFVRPGFEFGAADGIHADMTAAEFIAVWNRIRSIFNTAAVNNVAWVWDAVNPNTFNYMAYYPGDASVDWWGINYFTVSQMNNSDPFVLAAAAHQKPVIICESCPIHNGGTSNPANWENWFVPYFNKIAQHAHIKAFTYISDPWDRPGYFDDWDTSLIDADPTIQSRYATEMSSSRYIHMTAPNGDLDFDGDTDGFDFLTFSNCYNGSVYPPQATCENPLADLDADNDVDGFDFLSFSNCYNGSNMPSRCP